MTDAQLLRALGGRFATSAAALQHFRDRTEPRFFVTPETARARAAALAARYPHLADRTRAAAEAALRHEFDLLYSGPTSLGPRIDWHTDFKTGFAWPRDALYEDIDYSQLSQACDVKMPWELSRCYHFVTLGRAYALDRDPRYAREFTEQLNAWIVDNPYPRGVNWGRAMEVSLRAINWLWADALFADAPEYDDRTRLRLRKSLVQHGRYIAENLEFSDNNGNHYLSNGLGLLYLGTLLREVTDAPRWLAKGQEIVWGELQRQVHPDGVDFEKGIGYQGLVLEFWYSALLLSELNGLAVPAPAVERIERMFDFMLAYTRPDGTFPQIGDNDDGRLVALDDEPVGSHQRHLAVGGIRFNRPDLLAAAGDAVENAVWLVGEAALTPPAPVESPSSEAFPAGGFYVLRDHDAVMTVDAGEVGMNGIGGHGHNDLLSFDFWAAGAPLIVDSGTYTYTADPAARQVMRATAAHNTIRVDAQEIARMGDERWLWRIEDEAHPKVNAWQSDATHDLLDVQHDGYARLPQPVLHRRTIRFEKPNRTWLIEDHLTDAAQLAEHRSPKPRADASSPNAEHDIELFLHLALPIAEQDGLAVRLVAPRGDLWIIPTDPPEKLQLEVQQGWISRGYGHREPGPVLCYHLRAPMPVRLRTVLALVPSGTSLQDARSLHVASNG